MHRILLRTIVVDAPSASYDATRDFWATALGAQAHRGVKYPEYHWLEHPASAGPVLVQDIGTAGARFHLDIETDDIAAEVARLVSAGAVEVERHDPWVVLRDPAGLLFCVVPAGDAFAEAATEVDA